MTIVDDLFCSQTVVSTHEVAAALDLAERDAQSWASENNVSRIGASFAWVRDDVENLLDDLADEEADDEDPAEDIDDEAAESDFDEEHEDYEAE